MIDKGSINGLVGWFYGV